MVVECARSNARESATELRASRLASRTKPCAQCRARTGFTSRASAATTDILQCILELHVCDACALLTSWRGHAGMDNADSSRSRGQGTQTVKALAGRCARWSPAMSSSNCRRCRSTFEFGQVFEFGGAVAVGRVSQSPSSWMHCCLAPGQATELRSVQPSFIERATEIRLLS